MSAGNFIKNAENSSSGTVAADIVGELKKTRTSCDKAAKAQDQLLDEMEQAGNGMKALERTIRDFDISASNLQSDIQKTATEAHGARQAMSDTADIAERVKQSFSELPTKENFAKQIQDYVSITCNAIMEQTAAKQKEMQKVNRDIQNERIKTVLKWTGTLALVALVVCLFIFAVPAFFKTGMHFIDQHGWAQALAGVFMFVIVIGVMFLIGLRIGHD